MILFIITLLINIGMWFERFNIIVISLSKEFEPGSWGLYKPSWVEIGITVGSFALSDGTGTASNYTLTGGTHTLDITQAVLSSSGSRTYDATTTAAANAASSTLV